MSNAQSAQAPGRQGLRAWDDGELRLLAGLRIGWALLWLSVLGSFGQRVWYLDLPTRLWRPFPTLVPWMPADPSTTGMAALWWAAAVCTVAVLIGAWTRWAGPLAWGTSVALIGSLMSFGKIDHGMHAPLLILLLFAWTPWGATWSVDRWRSRSEPTRPADGRGLRWHLLATFFLVSLLYFSSALHKIQRGAYLDGPGLDAMMQVNLNSHRLFGDGGTMLPWLTEWMAAQAWLSDVLKLGALGFELLVFTLILTGRTRVIGWAAIILFHVGVALTTGIPFPTNTWLAVLLLGMEVALLARGRPGRIQSWFPARSEQGPSDHVAPGRPSAPWITAALAMVSLPRIPGSQDVGAISAAAAIRGLPWPFHATLFFLLAATVALTGATWAALGIKETVARVGIRRTLASIGTTPPVEAARYALQVHGIRRRRREP